MKLLHLVKWWFRKYNIPVVDYIRTCYYDQLNYGYSFFGTPYLKEYQEWKTWSGKVIKVKVLDYEFYSDPRDMMKFAIFQFLGYKEEKLLSEMNFKEYYEFITG